MIDAVLKSIFRKIDILFINLHQHLQIDNVLQKYHIYVIAARSIMKKNSN